MKIYTFYSARIDIKQHILVYPYFFTSSKSKGASEIRNALTALLWVFFLTNVIAEVKLPSTHKLSGAPPHTLFRQNLCFNGKRYCYLLHIYYNGNYSFCQLFFSNAFHKKTHNCSIINTLIVFPVSLHYTMQFQANCIHIITILFTPFGDISYIVFKFVKKPMHR